MAQGICEKYMKHLISEYYKPDDAMQQKDFENILRTHSPVSYTHLTDVDTDTISPTFVKLMDLYDGVKTGVQNWDGIINANAAAVHLEQAQSLLSGNADIDSFMTAHQDAISAAE